ncbi:MAG TPA: MBL fold metallo-hydrolase, partial [Thermoleophilaceae bacterium]|nr:MBL fold metallo-hydrolase [Thermoleophilaceae bacterium]
MDLDVVFVGTAGSAPTPARGLPAVLVRRGGDRLLFDCGEGTQRQLLRSVGLVDLEEVFVTHFHADHVLGLPGMLKTFSLRGRDRPLTVYGPRGLRDLFVVLRPLVGRLPFELSLVELEPNQELRRDGYRIAAFKTAHGVPACGYALVEDERLGRFDESRARELGVRPGPDFGRLHRGQPVPGSAGEVRPEQVV